MPRLPTPMSLTGQLRVWSLACLLVMPVPVLAERPAISREQAADIATSRSGGRVLNVKPVQKSGRPAYRVRVLKDGRVRTRTIDAEDQQDRRR